MRHVTLVVLLLGALVAVALGGCGQSKEDKAQSQVCDARADISKQVDTLKGLTISTATTDQITKSLSAIRDDLSKIAGAQGDLNDERKAQVQSANQQFSSQVRDVVSSVGQSLSLGSAKQQLTTALQQLATSYQQTFAKVDCSGT
jgi:Tfp pilus assembly protein PilP